MQLHTLYKGQYLDPQAAHLSSPTSVVEILREEFTKPHAKATKANKGKGKALKTTTTAATAHTSDNDDPFLVADIVLATAVLLGLPTSLSNAKAGASSLRCSVTGTSSLSKHQHSNTARGAAPTPFAIGVATPAPVLTAATPALIPMPVITLLVFAPAVTPAAMPAAVTAAPTIIIVQTATLTTIPATTPAPAQPTTTAPTAAAPAITAPAQPTATTPTAPLLPHPPSLWLLRPLSQPLPSLLPSWLAPAPATIVMLEDGSRAAAAKAKEQMYLNSFAGAGGSNSNLGNGHSQGAPNKKPCGDGKGRKGTTTRGRVSAVSVTTCHHWDINDVAGGLTDHRMVSITISAPGAPYLGKSQPAM
ncbi:hypothetical protein C8R44DRAFT_750441 [Mycena epipterygia]|nr:hypothetical protein C8R44DRAFT_750441 [Mycena epipterygia]